MPTFVPNSAERILLEHLFKTETPPALTCHLYKNDLTPDQDTVVGDLTEADFAGYDAVVMTRSGFSAPTTIEGEAVIAYGSTLSFEAESEQSVYGFYLTENTNDALVYVERFSTVKSLDDGSTLNLTVKISLSNKEA